MFVIPIFVLIHIFCKKIFSYREGNAYRKRTFKKGRAMCNKRLEKIGQLEQGTLIRVKYVYILSLIKESYNHFVKYNDYCKILIVGTFTISGFCQLVEMCTILLTSITSLDWNTNSKLT